MKDGDKTLKKKEFYHWVNETFTPLDNKVASIKGTLKVLVPLVIATFLAIMSLAIITVSGG